MDIDTFNKKKAAILSRMDNTIEDLERGHNEAARVRQVVESTGDVLEDLDAQFSKLTGLTKIDIRFLFVAIGLQVVRQYLITKFPEREDDQTAAKETKGDQKEKSDRKHWYYNPSYEQIISNPVPFDANIGANGALAGGGRLGHRVTAIGHDPILGLIFGTANIATSTLTNSLLLSFHIGTNKNKRDYFKSRAKTQLVLSKTADKVKSKGMEGKKIVATSLLKEIEHLKSDLYSKHSLPIPIIPAIDPKLASKLAEYGFDMANVVTVSKQASYSLLINYIIAVFHRLYYDGRTDEDEKLYEVRTRKILSYSNMVATSSNLAVVSATQDMDLLDLGGLGVTIYRLITDTKFIRQVKEEFIFGNYNKMIMGDYLNEY